MSLTQLQKPRSLASLRKSHSGKISVDQLLRNVGALQDPEILGVASPVLPASAF
ncbi:hypothetical protein [Sphingobium cupriresistens]|uniref:hypothetical protein n=1 Tax=Sphingobium cupriresistens TaxID=1132417 RepID=UPI0013EBDD49|nr:hypothetical protein [Sphingobium cupriresistens]